MKIRGSIEKHNSVYVLYLSGANYENGYMQSTFSQDVAELDVLKKYLESLLKHINEVRMAGKQLGVAEEQLYAHDLSKFSHEEFAPYANYFYGDPDQEAFNHAWLHHIHANKHHWQHYLLQEDSGNLIVLDMPENYALEMVADWIGASVAYTGSSNIFGWVKANAGKIALSQRTGEYVRSVLHGLGYDADQIEWRKL